jgi:predicted N-acyltransferase
MITWQVNLLKNGYVDFDDYMAEQAPKKKINKKKEKQ